MDQSLNLANLLSFVQIAVVFNFGLFFLRGKNTFKEICDEFNLYLASLAGYNLNDSIREVRRVRRTMPDNIKSQKERTCNYYRFLKNLTIEKKKNYFIIPCVGLFSGVYSLAFLLLAGMSGWVHDFFINEVLLVMAQLVLFMNFISLWQLRNKSEEGEVRYYSMINVIWFIILSLIALIFIINGWTFHIISDTDHVVLILVIVTVYFPALLLVLISLWKICKVLFFQLLCYYNTVKLKNMLDARRKCRG